MYTSFYTAARGAMEEQTKMDVIANNFANVNNYGFKPKKAVFLDLMYYNLNNYRGDDTPLKAGTGVVVETTDTKFAPTGFVSTEYDYDYAINEDGFFMMQSPISGAVTYTRNGHFSLSQRGTQFYLVNDNGDWVLDENRNPIIVRDGQLSGTIGVFRFDILDGMQSVGNNEYAPTAKNGTPNLVRGAKLVDHALELSGVDTAEEITQTIEAQRAYSLALRMVTTSDEIVTTINSLRQ